jgi:hypothetical protein
MQFFKWLFALTKRTRAARAALEVEAEGIVSDIREARARMRIGLGLDSVSTPEAPPAPRIAARSTKKGGDK